MNNSMESTEKEAGIFIVLKNTLIDTIETIFTEAYGLTIERSGEITSCDDEYLTFTNISSSIEFHGKLIGTVIIIVEKRFAQHLLKKMGLDALTPEEESEYIQDAMGELLNIILGYTTNKLLDKNIPINIDPPAVYNFGKKDVTVFKKSSFAYELNTKQGRCCLILNTVRFKL